MCVCVCVCVCVACIACVNTALLLSSNPLHPLLRSSRQFLAGVGAGICEAVLAVTPMETIKTKLIETNTNFVTVGHVCCASCVLCPVFCVLCPVFCVLCPVSCAPR